MWPRHVPGIGSVHSASSAISGPGPVKMPSGRSVQAVTPGTTRSVLRLERETSAWISRMRTTRTSGPTVLSAVRSIRRTVVRRDMPVLPLKRVKTASCSVLGIVQYPPWVRPLLLERRSLLVASCHFSRSRHSCQYLPSIVIKVASSSRGGSPVSGPFSGLWKEGVASVVLSFKSMGSGVF